MDSAHIDDLKRRIQKDPASIAFAQLGEEYRRAGRSREAIETCRAGLARHPGYLSARVTLGRALLDVGELDQAERELEEVLRVAPENLAALRGLGETLYRRGNRAAALAHYETALTLAPRDLDLRNTVEALREEVRREARVPTPPPPTPAPVVRPGPTPPVAGASAEAPPSRDAEDAARALPKLQRWLDAIVEDREQQTKP